MDFFFVDSILAFRKKIFDLQYLNFYQFLRQRNGINAAMAKLLSRHMGYNELIKLSDIESDFVTEKLRYFFIRNRSYLDKSLTERVNTQINKLVKMKSYRGLRHYYKYPTRGQRTRSNARTSRLRK